MTDAAVGAVFDSVAAAVADDEGQGNKSKRKTCASSASKKKKAGGQEKIADALNGAGDALDNISKLLKQDVEIKKEDMKLRKKEADNKMQRENMQTLAGLLSNDAFSPGTKSKIKGEVMATFQSLTSKRKAEEEGEDNYKTPANGGAGKRSKEIEIEDSSSSNSE